MRRVLAGVASIALAVGVMAGASPARAATGVVQIAASTATASVVAGNAAQMTLAWTKPDLNTVGDDTITGFLIYPTPSLVGLSNPYAVTLAQAACDADTSCEVVFPDANLSVGTAYTFRVAATTVEVPGGSGLSDASNSETAFVAPSPPTGVTAVPGVGKIGVSWTAPTNTGGLALTGYTATAAPGGATCNATPPTTSCTIGGLTNDTEYTVTVTATNAGPATSTPSAGASATPLASITVPGAPTIGTATVLGATSVSVAFAPPASNGGSAISGYTATCTPTGGGLTQSGTGTSSPITVSSLVTGTAYTCTVTATNIEGTGAASAASNSVTPAVLPPPGAPTSVSGTASDTSVFVSWSAPTPPPAATGYEVRYSSNSGSTWSTPLLTGSTATTFQVTGLTAGTGYIFQVRALNGDVAGAWSASSTVITPGAPGTPTAVSGVPGLGQVTVSWAAPGGALTPTSYQVRYSANGGVTWVEVTATGTTATSAIVSGLTNGTAYVFSVRAIRGAAFGDWSASSASVTPGAPAVPTSVVGTSGNARVTLTWVAPVGAPAATSYQIQYSSNGGATWLPAIPLTSASTTPVFTVTGLTNGVSYVFRVRALNQSVSGDWSATSAAVTPISPVTPTITIAGSRGAGGESRRIFVTGFTSGFEPGTVLAPFIRFPGQVGMTIGSARRQVNAQGEFAWTRLTGKKIAVRFATPQDEHRSNRVTIQARNR